MRRALLLSHYSNEALPVMNYYILLCWSVAVTMFARLEAENGLPIAFSHLADLVRVIRVQSFPNEKIKGMISLVI